MHMTQGGWLVGRAGHWEHCGSDLADLLHWLRIKISEHTTQPLLSQPLLNILEINSVSNI